MLLFGVVCVAGAAVGGYRALQVADLGGTNYRVIYTLLTRSLSWFAVLYFIAGTFVTFTSRRTQPRPAPSP